MNRRPFGRTGWQVSEIGFSGWAIGGEWGSVSGQDAEAALHAALDRGVNSNAGETFAGVPLEVGLHASRLEAFLRPPRLRGLLTASAGRSGICDSIGRAKHSSEPGESRGCHGWHAGYRLALIRVKCLVAAEPILRGELFGPNGGQAADVLFWAAALPGLAEGWKHHAQSTKPT